MKNKHDKRHIVIAAANASELRISRSMNLTIRITRAQHDALIDLAEATGYPIPRATVAGAAFNKGLEELRKMMKTGKGTNERA